MKRLLLLLFSSFLLVTCSRDDERVEQAAETPTTFIKTQSEIVSVNSNSIILSGNQDEIEVSDIVVSDSNENAPKGFLRKVVSKTESNGNTVLQTEQSTIGEAVKHFYEIEEEHEDSFSYIFQPSDATNRNNSGQIIPLTVNVEESITTTQGGIPITVTVSGELVVIPQLNTDIKIKNTIGGPRFERFELGISTDNDLTVSVNTEINASFDTEDIEVGEFTGAPINLYVGIPIVIVPKFKLFVGANGNLDANILYTYTNNSTINAGVEYIDGWQFPSDNGITLNSQSGEATASVSGNLKAYVKPEFSLSLYDESFVSGGVYVAPYARFDGQVNSTSYSYAINGGIDTGAFFEASLFGLVNLIDRQWDNLIEIPEWEIASGGYDIATITNPVPTDNANVTNQPITFSWQPNDFTVTPNYEILLGTDSNTLNSIGNTTNTSFEYTSTLSNNTYYWKVIARDTNNDIITESLIFSFTLNENSTVDAVNTPNPTDGAIDIAVNGNLSFTEGTNTPTDATFKVYFDTNTDPTTVFNLDADTNTLNYSNLQEGTAYFWKVETVSNTGDVLATSPIWSFTTLTSTGNTEPVFNPTPNDGASDVAINGSLSFTEGANTPTDATYRLYFDTNTTPTTQYDLGNQTSYNYSSLQENTTYYWFVETLSNSDDVLATSNTWSFVTEQISGNCIFEGDVLLQSQQEINDFASFNYCGIKGNLTLGRLFGDTSPTDISDLTPLSSLTTFDGNVLAIRSNPNLTSLGPGLENLEIPEINSDGFGVNIIISHNDNLTSLNGFGAIEPFAFSLLDNESLESLDGLQNVTFKSLDINTCISFNSFYGINTNITSLVSLDINNNDALSSLNGLNGITVNFFLNFFGNDSLTDYCDLNSDSGNASNFEISNNAYNPTQQDMLDGNCSQ